MCDTPDLPTVFPFRSKNAHFFREFPWPFCVFFLGFFSLMLLPEGAHFQSLRMHKGDLIRADPQRRYEKVLPSPFDSTFSLSEDWVS